MRRGESLKLADLYFSAEKISLFKFMIYFRIKQTLKYVKLYKQLMKNLSQAWLHFLTGKEIRQLCKPLDVAQGLTILSLIYFPVSLQIQKAKNLPW